MSGGETTERKKNASFSTGNILLFGPIERRLNKHADKGKRTTALFNYGPGPAILRPAKLFDFPHRLVCVVGWLRIVGSRR